MHPVYHFLYQFTEKIDTMTRLIFSLIICLSLLSSQAQKVHLKTGNLSLKHTDISIDIGYKVKIERVYNSTSNFKGSFGWGWTFEYAKNLTVNPDGSIVTKECECEGRTNNVFKPMTFDETAKSAAIDKISSIVQASQSFNTEELFNYKRKLINNRDFFIDEWKRLVDAKLVQPYVVPVGTQLVSKIFRYELLTKTETGYELQLVGEKKIYNDAGLLLRIEEGGSHTNLKSRNYIDLKYNDKNQLISIKDHLENTVLFSYTNNLVTEINTTGMVKEKVRYIYENDELVAVMKDNKEKYSYKYSKQKNHLLTEVYNFNELFISVYYSDDAEKKVSYIIGKDQSDSTAYTYTTEKISTNDLMKTGKSVKYTKSSYYDDEEEEEDEDNKKKENTGKNKYPRISTETESVYYLTSMEDGFQFNYRTINITNGIAEDNHNNEEGYPDMIIKGRDTTFFKYNAFGDIIFKENAKKKEEVVYDPVHGKMKEYKKLDKYGDNTIWLKFDYNDKGDLVSSENSEGKKVILLYDEQGKIKTMQDVGDNKILNFKYNKIGKPIEIEVQSVGKINVKYTANGEIEKVDSDGGHKIALEVTQAFQNLLALTKVDNMKPCKCTN